MASNAAKTVQAKPAIAVGILLNRRQAMMPGEIDLIWLRLKNTSSIKLKRKFSKQYA